MKILLTGGGSGGHITPLLAVAHELKRQRPDAHVVYVGQRGDVFADIPTHNPNVDTTYTIRAGKFRRYHGEGLRQLLDVKTIAKNMRDFFWFTAGLWQSWRLLGRLQPDVIFTRGGFVSVPIGLAAAIRRVPYITNDLDAVPSLTNRIIARWATVHSVAFPKEVYSYPPAKTFTVGVPISEHYKRVTPARLASYRRELGLEMSDRVLFVTGGGLGAQRLNEAIADIMPALLKKHSRLKVLHNVGRAHEPAMNTKYDTLLPLEQRQRVRVSGFVSDLYRLSGAADVVVTRAGATTIAELAVQAKACIVIPNPQLSGGHQLKNAEALAKRGAIKVIHEDQLSDGSSDVLEIAIDGLCNSATQRQQLSEQLGTCAHPDAAAELASLILTTTTQRPAMRIE